MEGTWQIEGVMAGTIELTRDAPATAEDEPRPRGREAGAGEEAGDEAARAHEIDFDGLEDRIHRISIPNASESRLLWSPDSKKLAFQTSVDGASGLYTVTLPRRPHAEAAHDHDRHLGPLAEGGQPDRVAGRGDARRR